MSWEPEPDPNKLEDRRVRLFADEYNFQYNEQVDDIASEFGGVSKDSVLYGRHIYEVTFPEAESNDDLIHRCGWFRLGIKNRRLAVKKPV